MQDILISVIVPAYNVDQYIGRCLDSILNQTHKNIEVLVIDDGSTDHTGLIIDEYAKKDDRIIAIHQENQGLAAVRENGIELAKGKYITFVDGDDSIEQDMYARLLANMIKYDAEISHCGVTFVYSDHKEYHNNTGIVKVQNNHTGQVDLLNGDLIEPALWNKLYLKELLINSCLDKSVVNNEDLLRNYIAFYRSKKSVFEDFCGYQYLQREGSMSKDSRKSLEIMKHISRARKTIVDHCREVNNDTVLPFAIRSWLNCYVNAANQYVLNFQNIDYVHYEEIRRFLKSQKKNIKYLIKRQQLAAWLIILSPKMHRIIYTIYSKRG